MKLRCLIFTLHTSWWTRLPGFVCTNALYTDCQVSGLLVNQFLNVFVNSDDISS